MCHSRSRDIRDPLFSYAVVLAQFMLIYANAQRWVFSYYTSIFHSCHNSCLSEVVCRLEEKGQGKGCKVISIMSSTIWDILT